jgi:cell division protein FtsX
MAGSYKPTNYAPANFNAQLFQYHACLYGMMTGPATAVLIQTTCYRRNVSINSTSQLLGFRAAPAHGAMEFGELYHNARGT